MTCFQRKEELNSEQKRDEGKTIDVRREEEAKEKHV